MALQVMPSKITRKINQTITGHYPNVRIRRQTMSPNEEKVIEFMKGRDFTGPSVMGMAIFNKWESSRTSQVCKRLVKKGLMVRNDKGHYKIKETNME